MKSSSSENSELPLWSHFSIDFSSQYNFYGKAVLNPVSWLTIKGVIFF